MTDFQTGNFEELFRWMMNAAFEEILYVLGRLIPRVASLRENISNLHVSHATLRCNAVSTCSRYFIRANDRALREPKRNRVGWN